MTTYATHSRGWLWASFLALAVVLSGRTTLQAEAPLPAYQKVPGLTGHLNSTGSDTLRHLMVYWAGAFQKLYPDVSIQLEGKGSAMAAPAISKGMAQLGPISRKFQPAEEQAFERKYGFRPTCFSVALDCLAVYVHKDNPLHGLTLAQLDCIFSKTHSSGYQDIALWGDVDLNGPWAKLSIRLYGRNSASGTYAYFKQHALFRGEYKDSLQEQTDSAAVVRSVAADRAGIGYSSISFRTPDVRVLPLSAGNQGPLVEATFENVLSGSYPLGRTLYVYVAKRPGERLPKVNEEFLKFVFSQEGQDLAVQAGYGALPHRVIARQLALLAGTDQ